MIYAISDMHGQYDAFMSLLKKINFKDTDDLYVLGDAIDRGPMPIECLQYIMGHDNIHMLLGNHELMMYETMTVNDRNIENNWHRNGGGVTAKKYLALSETDRKQILSYIKSLPLNFEITANGINYILCHAAPLCKYYDTTFEKTTEIYYFYNEKEYAVWMRRKPKPIENKTIIIGHTPTIAFQNAEKGEIAVFDGVIDIDCGAAYPDRGGRLCCFCLDTQEVFYQDIE